MPGQSSSRIQINARPIIKAAIVIDVAATTTVISVAATTTVISVAAAAGTEIETITVTVTTVVTVSKTRASQIP